MTEGGGVSERNIPAFGDMVGATLVEEWPLFVALFMWAIYGVFSLTLWQIIGGVISVLGAVIVAITGKAAP